MSDDTSLPPPLPEPPPPPPVSGRSVALAIFALISGLLLLVPGGLCSIMAIGMFTGGGEESQLGCLVGGIGVPVLAAGIGLLIFGARHLRRPRNG